MKYTKDRETLFLPARLLRAKASRLINLKMPLR